MAMPRRIHLERFDRCCLGPLVRCVPWAPFSCPCPPLGRGLFALALLAQLAAGERGGGGGPVAGGVGSGDAAAAGAAARAGFDRRRDCLGLGLVRPPSTGRGAPRHRRRRLRAARRLGVDVRVAVVEGDRGLSSWWSSSSKGRGVFAGPYSLGSEYDDGSPSAGSGGRSGKGSSGTWRASERARASGENSAPPRPRWITTPGRDTVGSATTPLASARADGAAEEAGDEVLRNKGWGERVRQIPGHFLPRRFRLFGLGDGKTGTVTLSRKFGRYRSRHEWDRQRLIGGVAGASCSVSSPTPRPGPSCGAAQRCRPRGRLRVPSRPSPATSPRCRTSPASCSWSATASRGSTHGSSSRSASRRRPSGSGAWSHAGPVRRTASPRRGRVARRRVVADRRVSALWAELPTKVIHDVPADRLCVVRTEDQQANDRLAALVGVRARRRSSPCTRTATDADGDPHHRPRRAHPDAGGRALAHR